MRMMDGSRRQIDRAARDRAHVCNQINETQAPDKKSTRQNGREYSGIDEYWPIRIFFLFVTYIRI